MTNASQAEIDAKNEAKAAKNDNVERVAKGLPQVASRPSRKVLSVMDILKSHQTSDAVKPKAGKQETAIAKADQIAKLCPELIKGLLKPDGTGHNGALVYKDDKGRFGRAGGVYICRYVPMNKSFAKFILERLGLANRTSTKSRLKLYTDSMNNGIGGDSGKHGWNFVFNTCILTVDFAGSISGSDLEMHNLAHTSKSLLACDDPNAEILVLFCFGVPKELRDNIDNNQARTGKDIASTRTELKEMFAVGSLIGGIVKIKDETMQTRCIGLTTQSITIINNIRNGDMAKTGGNQGVDADVLDKYSDIAGRCVQGIVGLDSVCGFDSVKKDGLPVKKTAGGLTRLYSVNHLAAVQALIAGFIDKGGNVCYSEEMGNTVLECYSLMASENETDMTEPMVFLRQQTLKWDKNKVWEGSSGRNVRFAALKMAVLKQIAGEKINNMNWLDTLTSKSHGPKLVGTGIIHVDHPVYGEDGLPVRNDDDTIYVEDQEFFTGIDDYVDPSEKAMESAGQAVATETDDELVPLDDEAEATESAEEMTEQASDVPEEEQEEETEESDELEEI